MDIDFRRLICALTALLSIGFSGAQVVAKEILFVYPPDGWRLNFKTEIANVRFFEYLPKDETPQQWTEMVTIQFIDNSTGLGPISLANDLRSRFVICWVCLGPMFEPFSDLFWTKTPVSFPIDFLDVMFIDVGVPKPL